jgi:hypothetical protein
MRIRSIAVLTFAAAVAIAGVTVAIAQQKPVTSRTSIVVYKSPT